MNVREHATAPEKSDLEENAEDITVTWDTSVVEANNRRLETIRIIKDNIENKKIYLEKKTNKHHKLIIEILLFNNLLKIFLLSKKITLEN